MKSEGLMINGVILAYSEATGGGVSTREGKRMFFHRKDWMSDIPPCTGQNVLLKYNATDGMLQSILTATRARNHHVRICQSVPQIVVSLI